MKKVRVFIERGADGSYSAYMPDDNGLEYGIIGDGQTVDDAKADIIASYEEMKEFFAEEGKPFTEIEMSFSFDTASFLAYYSGKLTLAGLSRITGVAPGQLSHYITGRRRPSAQTVKKISTSLHSFGNELSHVNFV